MICTVLQNKNFEEIIRALDGCEMAEIRLDTCSLTPKEIDDVFSSDVPLVATCRIGGNITVDMAEKRLTKAVEAGASFVDVEMGAPKSMSKRVRDCAHECGAVFIRSYHDYEGTDSLEALKALVDKCRYYGADMVKIATTARSEQDCERVLALYDSYEPYGLVAFCMGEAGSQSRIDCLAKGAPFTYACPDGGQPSAPGQLTDAEMYEKVYGDCEFVCGSLKMPASKSYAQRAIICAALADGTSHLHNYTSCGDNEAAIEVARALGAEVSLDGETLTVSGVGAGLREVAVPDSLYVGESGLLTRLMIPICARLAASGVRLTGEKTLLRRELDGVVDMMAAFGAGVSPEDGSGCTLPLTVTGPLKNGKVHISGRYGSQLISGLLLALPLGEKNTTIVVTEPKSIPYMFITLDVLKKFGVKVANDMLGGQDFLESGGDWSLCTELDFKVKGGQHFTACDIDLEGDWSTAANFLVAGAVFGNVDIDALDTTSVQADLSIMDILMDAGASLSQIDGEKGTVHVQRAPLSAIRTDCTNCPDLFPIVSVLAAFCQGENHICGVGRLVHKESDRGAAILEMLEKMGVQAGIDGDEMIIIGRSLPQRRLTGTLLHGGEYSSRHDHRMVMALKVASLGADSPILIDDETCTGKSCPGFLDMFETL